VPRLHRDFSRRYLPALRRENVRQFGLWEWLETGARRVGAEAFADWANRRGNASFGRLVVRLAEREPVDVLWGYNTSSVEVFRWAKRRGIRCILDQTIGHCASMNRVMLAEQARHPEFFLESFTPFSPAAIAQQDEEIALADAVVVGSEYCAQTLIENGCPASKVRIVPYGYDETLFPDNPPVRPALGGRPIEFLFVGLIYPRKGVAALLQAFETIPPGDARLTLVGRLEIPASTFQRFRGRVRHVSSVPRSEVAKYFLAADCLILPSLFEGGGIVLYEASAAGLGIIQSAHCGDGVREARNGQILADVSSTAIRAAILSVVANPTKLAGWQQASWEMRLERSWQRYRERVRALVLT
jgi:glycosyltransferase involved in cell wall biosynthesis